jgi:hypothetical protein
MHGGPASRGHRRCGSCACYHIPWPPIRCGIPASIEKVPCHAVFEPSGQPSNTSKGGALQRTRRKPGWTAGHDWLLHARDRDRLPPIRVWTLASPKRVNLAGSLHHAATTLLIHPPSPMLRSRTVRRGRPLALGHGPWILLFSIGLPTPTRSVLHRT